MSSESIRDLFIGDKFKFGEVKLPGLNLTLTLPPNTGFRFDGAVPSIHNYIASLSSDLRYWLPGIPTDKGGFNFCVKAGAYSGWMTVVKDISPRANVYNLAHESAEVLAGIGLYDPLHQLLQESGYDIQLKGRPRDHIGIIVGYAQALRQGYDVVDLLHNQDPEGFQLLQSLGVLK